MIHAYRGVVPTVHSTVWIAASADVIGEVEIGEVEIAEDASVECRIAQAT